MIFLSIASGYSHVTSN